MSVAFRAPDERAWIAGVNESGWHAVSVSACGGSLVSLCGRRVYGPFHRTIGELPPESGFDVSAARTACPDCFVVVPVWPVVDPCAETPTELLPVLSDSLDVLIRPALVDGRDSCNLPRASTSDAESTALALAA
jgi:hypothetical protein